ncbi:MAG: hypothetical protein H0T63_04675 [Pyrinomonadaceae bacterium]|jgi:hypothetical protein|nr:hypothetical protein [Pyrinomonadaceae bacterium]
MADEMETPEKIKQVRFIYQKARHHRTFHSDGMWASVTPQLEIQFAFFNNLKPMPADVIHEIDEQGGLGTEIERQMEHSIIREVDATVLMSKETLKGAIELLQRMIQEVEKLQKQVQVTQGQKQQDGETSKVE